VVCQSPRLDLKKPPHLMRRYHNSLPAIGVLKIPRQKTLDSRAVKNGGGPACDKLETHPPASTPSTVVSPFLLSASFPLVTVPPGVQDDWHLVPLLVALCSLLECLLPVIDKGDQIFRCEWDTGVFQGYVGLEEVVLTVGIAYQRSPMDPLVNATQCELDAALMADLGVNVIRGISLTLPTF
jgi:hypothetical protein